MIVYVFVHFLLVPHYVFSRPAETYEGKMGIVAGWGRLSEYGNASDVVREVKVPIMTNDECKTKNYDPKDITENMMCAGYDTGKIDACQVQDACQNCVTLHGTSRVSSSLIIL